MIEFAGVAIGTIVGVIVVAIIVQGSRYLRGQEFPPVKRLDKIHDAALNEVLKLFPERKTDNTWMRRADDDRFIASISSALADRALTAAQIRKLFKHTYTIFGDRKIKALFGWDEAVREAVEAAEEKVQRPPATPLRPKLPPISEANFEAFTNEFFSSNIDEIALVIDRWPYSFTFAQQAAILKRMGDTIENGKVTGDRSEARKTVRERMQICEVQPVAAKVEARAEPTASTEKSET